MTYRNREIKIVKNCLESLDSQKNKDFDVVLVDYGSTTIFKKQLLEIVSHYKFVTLIRCETTQQLWCKSRAINIALKQITAPFVFVGDVDMIYHPNCVAKFYEQKNETGAIYFQVGFLSEEESNKNKKFDAYVVDFKSQKEATGMTLCSTEALKSINGYDEFYNGWGSEDTDVHVRLKYAGIPVEFHTETLLMLHQWHPKTYRTKNDVTPFHPNLEQINLEYLNLVATTNKVKANINFEYGLYNPLEYDALNNVDSKFSITNKEAQVKALISHVLLSNTGEVMQLEVKEHAEYNSLKQTAKSLLGKKTLLFLDMQTVNNMLLEVIIFNLRDKAYAFHYNTRNQTILLTIKL